MSTTNFSDKNFPFFPLNILNLLSWSVYFEIYKINFKNILTSSNDNSNSITIHRYMNLIYSRTLSLNETFSNNLNKERGHHNGAILSQKLGTLSQYLFRKN